MRNKFLTVSGILLTILALIPANGILYSFTNIYIAIGCVLIIWTILIFVLWIMFYKLWKWK